MRTSWSGDITYYRGECLAASDLLRSTAVVLSRAHGWHKRSALVLDNTTTRDCGSSSCFLFRVILIFNLFIYLLLLKKKYNLSAMQLHSELKIKRCCCTLVFLSFLDEVGESCISIWSPSGTLNYFLLCMDAICGPLQGFCNAIVYGINQKLRNIYIYRKAR